MDTVENFIRELQSLSPEKRKLPIRIVCPNSLTVYPNVKMRIKEGTFMTPQQEVESIIITWQD